jgi:hypothetical protein
MSAQPPQNKGLNLSKIKPMSFTIHYSGIVRTLITDAHVLRPGPENNGFGESTHVRALWDTGATNSVITTEIVAKLGLIPIGKTRINGVHGAQDCNSYMVSVGLPNKVAVQNITVTEVAEFAGGFQLLIGMDIIKEGDFAVTVRDDRTLFSFRIPSCGEIDFVDPASSKVWPKHMNRQAIRNAQRKKPQIKKSIKRKK